MGVRSVVLSYLVHDLGARKGRIVTKRAELFIHVIDSYQDNEDGDRLHCVVVSHLSRLYFYWRDSKWQDHSWHKHRPENLPVNLKSHLLSPIGDCFLYCRIETGDPSLWNVCVVIQRSTSTRGWVIRHIVFADEGKEAKQEAEDSA